MILFRTKVDFYFYVEIFRRFPKMLKEYIVSTLAYYNKKYRMIEDESG